MKYTSCSLLALLSFPIVGIAETSAFFSPGKVEKHENCPSG